MMRVPVMLSRNTVISVLFALFLPGLVVATEPAHDFTLPADKGSVSLNQYKGQVVYLDFWASWCGPCRQSFPWMNEMQQRYGAQGFKVIAINLDKEKALREKFIEMVPAKFTIAYDPDGKVAEKYGIQGMPSSYLIDRNGNISARHLGFRDKDSAELEQKIQSLLK